MKRQLLAAMASVWMLGAGVASADVGPPDGCYPTNPDIKPCDGKTAGDACMFANGTKGSCAALRCKSDGGATLHACVKTGSSTPSTGCSAAGASSAGLGFLLAGSAALTLATTRRRRKS